ncbi:hypothetical protein ABBQ32_004871 [Trebouxia sp. C0010 RCD-2024]
MRSAHHPRSSATVSSLQQPGALIQHKSLPKCYVIGGVSGSGKSTVGRMLADRLNCSFYEGDDYHPKANKDKMHSGISLQDEDRWPWLDVLADIVHQHIISAICYRCGLTESSFGPGQQQMQSANRRVKPRACQRSTTFPRRSFCPVAA